MFFVETTPDLENQITTKVPLDRGPSPVVTILNTYYNAGNYFLVSPFIFKQEPRENGYQLTARKRNAIFQFLLCILHLWIVIGTTYDHYYLIIANTEVMTLRIRFKLILIGLWTFTVCIAVVSSWTNGPSLSNVFDKAEQICIQLERLNVSLPSQATCTVISISLVLIVFFWSVMSDFFWLYIQHLLGQYDFNTFLKNRSCAHDSQFCDLVNNFQSLSETSPSWTYKIFISLIHIGHSYWVEITIHYAYSLALLHGIFLYIIVRQFIQFLETNSVPHDEYNLVLDIVEELCEFCEILDGAIGFIVAATCFTMLSYYSNRAQALFHHSSWLKTCRFFTDGFVVGTFLILSAHAHSKLGSVRNWLQKIQKTCKFGNLQEQALWQNRLNITLHQLASGNIGIRGKFFTITYGFVGTMASLVLTYSLLISQLYSAE